MMRIQAKTRFGERVTQYMIARSRVQIDRNLETTDVEMRVFVSCACNCPVTVSDVIADFVPLASI